VFQSNAISTADKLVLDNEPRSGQSSLRINHLTTLTTNSDNKNNNNNNNNNISKKDILIK